MHSTLLPLLFALSSLSQRLNSRASHPHRRYNMPSEDSQPSLSSLYKDCNDYAKFLVYSRTKDWVWRLTDAGAKQPETYEAWYSLATSTPNDLDEEKCAPHWDKLQEILPDEAVTDISELAVRSVQNPPTEADVSPMVAGGIQIINAKRDIANRDATKRTTTNLWQQDLTDGSTADAYKSRDSGCATTDDTKGSGATYRSEHEDGNDWEMVDAPF